MESPFDSRKGLSAERQSNYQLFILTSYDLWFNSGNWPSSSPSASSAASLSSFLSFYSFSAFSAFSSFSSFSGLVEGSASSLPSLSLGYSLDSSCLASVSYSSRSTAAFLFFSVSISFFVSSSSSFTSLSFETTFLSIYSSPS